MSWRPRLVAVRTKLVDAQADKAELIRKQWRRRRRRAEVQRWKDEDEEHFLPLVSALISSIFSVFCFVGGGAEPWQLTSASVSLTAHSWRVTSYHAGCEWFSENESCSLFYLLIFFSSCSTDRNQNSERSIWIPDHAVIYPSVRLCTSVLFIFCPELTMHLDRPAGDNCYCGDRYNRRLIINRMGGWSEVWEDGWTWLCVSVRLCDLFTEGNRILKVQSAFCVTWWFRWTAVIILRVCVSVCGINIISCIFLFTVCTSFSLLSTLCFRLGWMILDIIENRDICRHLRYFHNVKYWTAVTASLGFYFEKKIHAELLWRWSWLTLLFNEVERLSPVNWHDVGMHAAL